MVAERISPGLALGTLCTPTEITDTEIALDPRRQEEDQVEEQTHTVAIQRLYRVIEREDLALGSESRSSSARVRLGIDKNTG